MLTDTQIRKATPGDRLYKLWDGRGLYLTISPGGSKTWRLRLTRRGRDHDVAIGPYPQVSVTDARETRDRLRLQIMRGEIETIAAEPTFAQVAREWAGKQPWSAEHADQVRSRLERLAYPVLGATPISQITPAAVLSVVRPIDGAGTGYVAHRVLGIIGSVCRYAVATQRAPSDPTRDLRGALAPARHGHIASVIDEPAVASVLRRLRSWTGGTLVVRSAMLLLPLTFVRPGELRMMRWDEIDGSAWSHQMSKVDEPHVVPLSRQAMAILDALPRTSPWVFVSPKGRAAPISDTVIGILMRSAGVRQDEITPHGWRATARTMLDEVLGYPPHVIEHQLGHVVRDPLGRAYNRTRHLDQRREMMQRWADYLDGLVSAGL